MTGRVCCGIALAALVAASVGANQSTSPPRTTNDGVFTDEQAKRGAALYQQQCAMCHGPALAGMEMASPLTGPEFAASWNDGPLGDLFERIRVTMPMDKPGSLSRQQTADFVAFILSFNKSPAGPTELPVDAEVLKAIRLVSPR